MENVTFCSNIFVHKFGDMLCFVLDSKACKQDLNAVIFFKEMGGIDICIPGAVDDSLSSKSDRSSLPA